MPKLATRILFSKNNSNVEPDFCEACTLGKKHKVYSKEPTVNITDEFGVRLYIDLYSGRNSMPGVESDKYGTIFINEATLIRFPITTKS